MDNLHQLSFTHDIDEKISNIKKHELIQQLPDWDIVHNDIDKLQRIFRFANFADAITFTNKVAKLAEEYNHHPAILTEWGKVTITWWTHKVNGLHLNDFVMAAKTDYL